MTPEGPLKPGTRPPVPTAPTDAQLPPVEPLEGIVKQHKCMCVFITAVPNTKLFAREGGGEDMCYV